MLMVNMSTKRKRGRNLLTKFKQGDLFFGLSTSNEETIDKLKMRKFHHTYANTLNGRTIPIVVDQTPIPNDLSPEELAHINFLSQHRDYLLAPGGKPVPKHKNDPNPTHGIAFRRACKILVTKAEKTRRVHFELDKIDLARTCNISSRDDGVTNSELRALYRDAQKNGPNPHVFFYNRGRSVKAPWLQRGKKRLWKEYADYRLRKNKQGEEFSFHVTTPSSFTL